MLIVEWPIIADIHEWKKGAIMIREAAADIDREKANAAGKPDRKARF